ncbi:MAG TPA: hypothetical protein VEC56_02355 [Candidatus Krumholzibacteria bacterium]|nr:hypothetical protein [Candidatus Krumholzibacteria bacterium]
MTSGYWQCGKCGALHTKDPVRRATSEKYIETGAPVLGHETCAKCSTRYDAEEIYRGRRDPPQLDSFVAEVISDPTSQWNAALKVWTRKRPLAKDIAVILELDPATVAHYRDSASPLQLAAVALAKTEGEEIDLHSDSTGLVVPGGRITSDFPSWRVWLSARGHLWVTKKRVAWEDYSESGPVPEALKHAHCAGPVPAIPYLVGLCMAAGLDPNKLSPLEIKRLDEAAAKE